MFNATIIIFMGSFPMSILHLNKNRLLVQACHSMRDFTDFFFSCQLFYKVWKIKYSRVTGLAIVDGHATLPCYLKSDEFWGCYSLIFFNQWGKEKKQNKINKIDYGNGRLFFAGVGKKQEVSSTVRVVIICSWRDGVAHINKRNQTELYKNWIDFLSLLFKWYQNFSS